MGTTRSKKIIIIIIGVACLAWAFWPNQGAESTDADDDGLQGELINRLWIDKIPTSMTDKIDVLALIDDPHAGVFQNTSAYEGDFSIFEWRPGDTGKVRIFMLQTERVHKMKYRVSNKDCGRFDLCMRVKGAPRGAKRYHSMEDWVISAEQKNAGHTLNEAVGAALRALIRERIFDAQK